MAKRLVASLSNASTPGARKAAVLKIFKAARIPVVRADGTPVAGVMPRPNASRLFFHYDFELAGVGGAYARNERITLDDVARRLSVAGFELAPGRPLPASVLLEGIRETIRAAKRKPRLERAALPLLLAELARRRGQDFVRAAPGEQIRLDPVQAALVTADMAVGLLRKVPLPAARGSFATAALPSPWPTAPVRAAALPGDCERFTKASEALEKQIEAQLERFAEKAVEKWVLKKGSGYLFGMVSKKLRLEHQLKRLGLKAVPRWAVRGTLKVGKTIAKVKEVASPIIDLVHGSLLAYSIKVVALDEALPAVHWRHAAGEGQKAEFRVLVINQDDWGEHSVKCGKHAGVEFPPKGPVEGVYINWEQVQTDITKQGKLDCLQFQGVVCASKTGADGIARLTLTPNAEEVPEVGPLIEETGVVSGIAMYQSASGGSIPSEIAQVLTPKYGSIRWFVARHESPNLFDVHFRGSQTYTQVRGGAGDFEDTVFTSRFTYSWDVTWENVIVPRDGSDPPEGPCLGLPACYDEDANYQSSYTITGQWPEKSGACSGALTFRGSLTTEVKAVPGGYRFRLAPFHDWDDQSPTCSGELGEYVGSAGEYLPYPEGAVDSGVVIPLSTLNEAQTLTVPSLGLADPFRSDCTKDALDMPCSQSLTNDADVTFTRVTRPAG